MQLFLNDEKGNFKGEYSAFNLELKKIRQVNLPDFLSNNCSYYFCLKYTSIGIPVNPNSFLN